MQVLHSAYFNGRAKLPLSRGWEGEAPAEPGAPRLNGRARLLPSRGWEGEAPAEPRLSGSFALPSTARQEPRPPSAPYSTTYGSDVFSSSQASSSLMLAVANAMQLSAPP